MLGTPLGQYDWRRSDFSAIIRECMLTHKQGDYDGDTMEAFWQPEIVNSFTNANPMFAVEPAEVQACLVKNKETVEQFLARVPPDNEEKHIRAIQKYLLGPLQDPTLVGKYSIWWENMTYKNGYRHPDTHLLAYLYVGVGPRQSIY